MSNATPALTLSNLLDAALATAERARTIAAEAGVLCAGSSSHEAIQRAVVMLNDGIRALNQAYVRANATPAAEKAPTWSSGIAGTHEAELEGRSASKAFVQQHLLNPRAFEAAKAEALALMDKLNIRR